MLTFKNICLINLSINDIDSLRLLRNEYKNFLINKEEIDFESQKEWYNNINTKENIYFKILKNNEHVGFIFVKNINFNDKSFETGLFISKKFKKHSSIGIASLMLSYYFFVIKDFKKAIAFVHKNNDEAIAFNSGLMFEKIKLIDDFYEFHCKKESFLSFLEKLKLTESFRNNLKFLNSVS